MPFFEVQRTSKATHDSVHLGLVEADSIESALAKVTAAGLPTDWGPYSRGEIPAYYSVTSIKGGYGSPQEANQYNAECNEARQKADARSFPDLAPRYVPVPTDLRVLQDAELAALMD